nr:hypothetical protein [Tanacetum cinerariifolium]
ADIGTRNTAYLRDLLMEISQIDNSVDEDTRTWSLADDGIFSVRSARRPIDSKLLSSILTSTLWDQILPRKVNIFLWTLSLDRLSHRLNLSSRGLDIPTISYSSCNAKLRIRTFGLNSLVRPQGLSNPWGFFEKQRLTGPNFMDWYRQLRIVLSVEDKLDYLEKPTPSAPIPAQAKHELLQTVRDFHSCKQEEGQSVSSYVLKMKSYIDNLERLGQPVSLNLEHKKPQPQLAARGQNQGIGKNKLAYAPKPKISPPPKREDPAKDSVYHQCGDTCHWKRNCPQYLAELLKNKKLSQGASVSAFQKEVESQLGKTIKSLHSDREGEYMSQEFLDHPKDYVIIAHRTPLYTLQHNDVSEKRNKTLLDMKVKKTPYKVWHGQVPKLSYLKVWGCEALVKRDTLTKRDKLEPMSIKCIFIGYPKETMGYSFYYPPENKVLVARNAEFLKNILITQEASGSLEDLEINEPQSDIIPIRRFASTRYAPDRMCLYIDAGEHELGNLGEPANYKAALLDPESNKCLDAINVEMQSMKDNEVWDLVELPPIGKTVGSKWLFKKKADMDEAVYTFKARLVVMGFTQTYGVDYEETFAPVADIRAIRILIAIVAYYDYEI